MNADEFVLRIWNYFNKTMDDLPWQVVEAGGAVAITHNSFDNTVDIDLILKEITEDTIDEWREAIAAGAKILFYWGEWTGKKFEGGDEEFRLKVLMAPTWDDLEKAVKEIRAHLEKTGGVDLE
ncbi:hypothetical protein [Thermococcus sp. ES12]|uniref:hypothetical protein n=1 Tax=Thermococcus sp. ES12 TaxID=1638246 RepID=UPI001431B230|nr:hypothetical protein [Thermococcus sp. ES12]NJE75956.1 hypothetical protein [Thermococcus sp. ES12]